MLYKNRLKRELPMHLMLIPGILIVLVFSYGPMVGLVMAFQKYIPIMGMLNSKWVGLDNFKLMMKMPDIYQVIYNTVFIASMKIIFGTLMTIMMALLLNEVLQKTFKRSVQILIYLPYFLSWIILGGILRDVLSLNGIVNQFLGIFNIGSVMFLGENNLFPFILVATDIWQNVGFGTIVYIAAITNISPTLYEAAVMDGAGRLRQAWHITLSGIRPIIVLMVTLSLGAILNAGFDQILVLYSPMVYKSGDVIDTWVYRTGIVQAQYSIATAVGLFRSVVAFLLISISYYMARRFANYRIF